MDEALIKRLRWRARRGTRELDRVFGGWLDRHRHVEPAQLAAFAALLEAQDPELWDWVMGHARPPREDWQRIIDEIRTCHQL